MWRFCWILRYRVLSISHSLSIGAEMKHAHINFCSEYSGRILESRISHRNSSYTKSKEISFFVYVTLSYPIDSKTEVCVLDALDVAIFELTMCFSMGVYPLRSWYLHGVGWIVCDISSRGWSSIVIGIHVHFSCRYIQKLLKLFCVGKRGPSTWRASHSHFLRLQQYTNWWLL